MMGLPIGLDVRLVGWLVEEADRSKARCAAWGVAALASRAGMCAAALIGGCQGQRVDVVLHGLGGLLLAWLMFVPLQVVVTAC